MIFPPSAFARKSNKECDVAIGDDKKDKTIIIFSGVIPRLVLNLYETSAR